MSGPQLALVGLAAAAFGGFAVGALVLFRPSETTRGLSVLKVAAVLCGGAEIGVLASSGDPPAAAGWVGGVLFAVSIGLFTWTAVTTRARPLALAYSVEDPTHLLTTGPYRLVRHPFYSSYLIAYCAGVVATRQLALLVAVATMITIYARAALQEESRFVRGPLGGAYLEYRARTGMFSPRWVPR